jgi:hypothetical protein
LLQDETGARGFFGEARELYAELGDTEGVRRCDDQLGQFQMEGQGAVDVDISRLQARLATESSPSAAHAALLIEIGELYSKQGDDFSAREVLTKAEREMNSLPGMPPTSGSITRDLAETVAALQAGTLIPGKSPLERSYASLQLQIRLYFALGNVYRESEPEKAELYTEKLEEMRGLDAIFSKVLSGLGARISGLQP